MLKWIKDGAKLDVEETGAFDRLEVFPRSLLATRWATRCSSKCWLTGRTVRWRM